MGSASTRKQTVRYMYDALGRRVQRTAAGGKENTKFTYDGQEILLDNDSGIVTKYLNGPGIDHKMRMEKSGAASYFVLDHLGSTNALMDTNGVITSQASYDSFGNQTGNLATRYGFTGRENDSFTGLMHYRARQYDPKLGRFISEDPVKFRGGINWFVYTKNNPINFIDPLGLSPTNCETCPAQAQPKLWDKPEFDSGPYSQPNMFTNIERGSFEHFWDDPLGTLVNAIPYYCYNYVAKPFLGDFGAARPSPGIFGKSGAGFPAGEMINTLELGPDLYNTLDTVDRRNQDYNDAIRCASGNCSMSPYNRGNGLGGGNNGWQPRPPQ